MKKKIKKRIHKIRNATKRHLQHYMQMQVLDERKLLENIKKDPSEFAKVFDRYYREIFGYIFRRTGNYDVARDIAAETFLKAYLSVQGFQWRGNSLRPWLYRIATNETNMYFRKQKSLPETTLSDIKWNMLVSENILASERTALEQEMEKNKEFARVRECVSELPLKYQEVISLRYFEQKSNTEISQILDKPEGTIKSLLSRGLEKIREKLGKVQP